MLVIGLSLLAAKEAFKAVHVKRQGEAQCLIKRGGLGGGKHVGCIQTNHIQGETGTETEILTVTFVLALMIVAGT